MRLLELEQAFWAAVRTRGEPPPGLDALFTPSPTQTATERLAVYHVAYWHRQLAALAATFPRTQTLLGAGFERLCFAYVEARPCGEPCIERLGAGFADFLAEQDAPELTVGVARLEWAATAALLARNAPRVASLTQPPGASFVDCFLTLAPSLQVAHVTRAALRIYESSEPSSGIDEASTIDVAFYRPQHGVRHAALPPDEAHALSLARGEATIALICSAFSDLSEEHATARALGVLRGWFVRGWVTACEPRAK